GAFLPRAAHRPAAAGAAFPRKRFLIAATVRWRRDATHARVLAQADFSATTDKARKTLGFSGPFIDLQAVDRWALVLVDHRLEVLQRQRANLLAGRLGLEHHLFAGERVGA